VCPTFPVVVVHRRDDTPLTGGDASQKQLGGEDSNSWCASIHRYAAVHQKAGDLPFPLGILGRQYAAVRDGYWKSVTSPVTAVTPEGSGQTGWMMNLCWVS
jgi:hypothetical protein